MNKVIRFIQNYLILGLPFVVVCMVWETIYPEIEFVESSSMFTKFLWETLACNLMLWFIVLILFLFSLVVLPSIREKTLRRLANLKERDEREQYITGKASRAAYIATLSLMLFFLFFSMFTLNIYSVPKEQAIAGHRHRATINFGFSLHNNFAIKKIPEEKILFDSKDISLSNPAMILILLSWQLLVFNFTARKEQYKDID